jgi:hypothetical protein
LVTDDTWVTALERFALRHPRRRDRLAEYKRLVDTGAHIRAGEAVLDCSYCPAPPAEKWISKLDGRKKRLFMYPPADELLFRVVNQLLQPHAEAVASPWCRSFLPGGGARMAFRGVLAEGGAEGMAAFRLDVSDYFNSIDVKRLLERLPPPLSGGAVGALISASLCDRRVVVRGSVTDGGQKGVMAGTPLAPLLSTLYLRELDFDIAQTGVRYSRYSDDILVLAPASDLPDIEAALRRGIAEHGLEVNERKSALSRPGEPWDFLGFRYQSGSIGLAPVTEQKAKAKATRLARRLWRWCDRTGSPPGRAVESFVQRTNVRLYGRRDERADFSWATWFLPLLTGPGDLEGLDVHVQREARYAATGRRRMSTRRAVPYADLVGAGHLPLVAAFWALRDGPGGYAALVSRRTGL